VTFHRRKQEREIQALRNFGVSAPTAIAGYIFELAMMVIAFISLDGVTQAVSASPPALPRLRGTVCIPSSYANCDCHWNHLDLDVIHIPGRFYENNWHQVILEAL
jgi:hypothetical protein